MLEKGGASLLGLFEYNPQKNVVKKYGGATNTPTSIPTI
jgi:hypothetical protein